MTDLVITGVTGQGSADLGDWRQVFWVGCAVTAHTGKQTYLGSMEPYSVAHVGYVGLGYLDDGTSDVPGGEVISLFQYLSFDYQQFLVPAEIYTSVAWHKVYWGFTPGVTATVFVQWTAV